MARPAEVVLDSAGVTVPRLVNHLTWAPAIPEPSPVAFKVMTAVSLAGMIVPDGDSVTVIGFASTVKTAELDVSPDEVAVKFVVPGALVEI